MKMIFKIAGGILLALAILYAGAVVSHSVNEFLSEVPYVPHQHQSDCGASGYFSKC